MRYYVVFLALFLIALGAQASVESQLIGDIKQAQLTLNKTQQGITNQSQKLNLATHKAEQSVLKLRNQTATARRLVDEQTLSLNTLEKRLKTWQQQDTYQRNLLARFSLQQKNAVINPDMLATESLSQLSDSFSAIRRTLYPQWHTQSVVTTAGLIKQQSTLSIGPVAWYVDDEHQRAGFLINKNNVLKHGLALPSQQFEQLTLLAQHQPAQVSFDPTLTRALKIAQAKESILQHVKKGGVWVLPILAFGLFALVISLVKGLVLSRLPHIVPALAERLSHIDANNTSQVNQLKSNVNGMQQELLTISLASRAGQHRDDQLFSALLQHKHRLEYWLGAVAITAAVSPLLGLLGTVSGMIETFKLMTLFGAGDASAVSGGISEALVTTELGLVVAIPALLMHALLSRKVKTYYGALEGCAVQLSQASTQPLVEAA